MDLGRYYEIITRTPLLSKEEEYDLFLELQDRGISKARKKQIEDIIIKSNLRFVFKEAKKRSGNDPYLFEELIAAGNEGLLIGMPKYDPDSGFRFLTYSGWWVVQRMLSVMGKQRIVSLPVWRQQLLSRIEKYLAEKPDASIEDLQEQFPGVSTKDLNELISTKFLTFYIEDLGEDREFEINPIETIVDKRLDNENILNIVETLPELHKAVIQQTFGLIDGDDTKKPADICKALNISREKLNSIKKEAFDILKSKLGNINPFC
jgi:RNA polymerase primary sigma factor